MAKKSLTSEEQKVFDEAKAAAMAMVKADPEHREYKCSSTDAKNGTALAVQKLPGLEANLEKLIKPGKFEELVEDARLCVISNYYLGLGCVRKEVKESWNADIEKYKASTGLMDYPYKASQEDYDNFVKFACEQHGGDVDSLASHYIALVTASDAAKAAKVKDSGKANEAIPEAGIKLEDSIPEPQGEEIANADDLIPED